MTPGEAAPVVGVVLAGGRSRRMGGGDKSFALLSGLPLVAHAVTRLAPQVAAIVVSANAAPERYLALGLPVVADTVPGFAGPLAGFLAGMEWAGANVPLAMHVVTVATDTPFFPTDLVARLSAAAGPEGMAVARTGGRIHPVFALLPVSAGADLTRFIAAGGSLKVADWLARHDVAAVDFDDDAPGFDPFLNINTPEDLIRAEAITGGCTPP